MRKIAIIGIGQTPVCENWEQSIREIAGEAVFAALQDAQREQVEGIFVGNMLSGVLSRQENLGAMVVDWTGLHGAEAMKVEAACGSGAAALRMAIMAVGSGELNSAIALGVEKMTEDERARNPLLWLQQLMQIMKLLMDYRLLLSTLWLCSRYLLEFKWKHTDFAPFSINAHANAIYNPNARLHEAITEKDYQRARMVADPINLLDASPIGDGAAAVLIVPVDDAGYAVEYLGRPMITIEGSASATDSLAVAQSARSTDGYPAWEKSAKKAYSQAGISPSDIDLFELHDAFSIMAALSLEACGFAETRPGASSGSTRRHLAFWAYSNCHTRWVEGSRPSSRGNRHLSDR